MLCEDEGEGEVEGCGSLLAAQAQKIGARGGVCAGVIWRVRVVSCVKETLI